MLNLLQSFRFITQVIKHQVAEPQVTAFPLPFMGVATLWVHTCYPSSFLDATHGMVYALDTLIEHMSLKVHHQPQPHHQPHHQPQPHHRPHHQPHHQPQIALHPCLLFLLYQQKGQLPFECSSIASPWTIQSYCYCPYFHFTNNANACASFSTCFLFQIPW